jgi:Icc-related predicted phosphoesterase
MAETRRIASVDIAMDPGRQLPQAGARMKLLFVADLHYALKQFDWVAANAARFDATVIGGDLLDLGSFLDLDVQIVVIEKYLNRLRRDTPLIVSSGNHDTDRRNESGEAIAQWLREAKAPQLFVDGDGVEFNGTLITVCPWWDGPITRAEVEQQLAADAARPKAKWIWIHHAPPDQSPVSWTGKVYGGDPYLVEWIERFQPDLVLSGHIHNAPFYPEGSWVDQLGKTWVFNPGKQPGPQPTFLAIDLDQMSVEWVSIEGEDQRQLMAEEAS